MLRAMKKMALAVLFIGLSAGLAACGDEAKPGAAASGTAKAEAKPAPTGTATAAATGEPKKDDSGW